MSGSEALLFVANEFYIAALEKIEGSMVELALKLLTVASWSSRDLLL